ncbi:hypothetical protein CDAR_585851 [Caerostris darwini]|uniref:Uncharacterized protein n=1 Tax=Caerostris darwini TaxID=1538125 RepID=A0AAV4TJX7_9ARAC|nr:hypothetical protein CDAR_585851 [Caerostris darwini]
MNKLNDWNFARSEKNRDVIYGFKHTTDSSLPVSTTLLKSLMCYSEANFKAYCPHRWLASGPNPKLRTFS